MQLRFLLLGIVLAALQPSSTEAGGLEIHPKFVVTVTNVTTNFTANMPVTWELVTKAGDAQTALNSGYSVEYETPTEISIMSGYSGGIFVLSGTAAGCVKRGPTCQKAVTYIVLSDVQASLIGLLVASLLTLSIIWILSFIKPVDPQDKLPCDPRTGKPMLDTSMRDNFQYGSFPKKAPINL